MKRFIYMCLTVCLLVGCSTYRMPPFSQQNDWKLSGNTVSSVSKATTVDFAKGEVFPIINASNGEYDLNFITSQADFDRYDPTCAKYIKDVLKSIPMNIESIDLILADRYLILTPSIQNHWLPDYVRRGDGAQLVTQANPVESDVQAHDELWRNYVINEKMNQIVVVDRIVKNGKHLAIAYIMQSEKHGLPFHLTTHYDILDKHNIQAVGTYMEYLLGITTDALHSTIPAQ